MTRRLRDWLTRSGSEKPRLAVLVGAGGVGKTTLAAALAFSLATRGAKVGLLSIDPARRLRSALGLERLGDEAVRIPWEQGEVWAAELQPEACLKRWIVEEGAASSERLFDHPFFQTLALKLAASSDVFAAARVAEMTSHGFDFVVVDTAPGIHAIDFLTHPDRTMAFLDSRLFDWLKALGAGSESWLGRLVRDGTRKVLSGLGAVGGERFLLAFADFLVLLEPILESLAKRLEVSRRWFRAAETQFFVVATARPDSLAAADALAAELAALDVPFCAAVLNRAWPAELRRDPGFVTFFEETRALGARAFAAYLEALGEREAKARLHLESLAERVISVPVSPGLSGDMRLRDLANLGEYLRVGS